MDDALIAGILSLGQLQFETGGVLLSAIVKLREALEQERARRAAEPWRATMSRTLWCQNPGCGTGYASVAGDIPKVCPACDQPAHWSTEAGPKVPFALSSNDKRFLRSLKITSEYDESVIYGDDDDGA